ncbi:hypothetical protein AMJ80_03385, partial [bacterium SM23_31]
MENKNIINRIRNTAGLCLVLVLFTGMVNDAFSQEVMVLDLETSMRIALTQSNDIIRQQNSFEQSKLGLEFAKANQRTRTTLTWSLPSYSKRITPIATPTGDVYTNNQSFSTSASLNITQPVRWTDGTISFRTNYSANNQYTLEKDGSKRQNHNWTDSFNISYSQPLFQPNEQKFDWDQNNRDFTIAQREYEQTENSIWLNVMRDFYNLYRAKRRLEIAQADFDNTKKNYEMADNKYKAGILAEVDKLQWESTLMNAENSLVTQELSYKRLKDDFKRTIGLPLDQQIDVVAEIDVKFIEIDEQQAFDE